MSKDVKFAIESLQRTKIIMVCETVAVNTSVMLGTYLVNSYLPDTIFSKSLIIVGGLFGITYALYACIGNAKRHKEIRMLEREL